MENIMGNIMGRVFFTSTQLEIKIEHFFPRIYLSTYICTCR